MGYEASKTYVFSDLIKTHKNFIAPQFHVTVGSKKLDPAKVSISDVQIIMPLTIGSGERIEAGEASFSVLGAFDMEQHKFKEDLTDTLKIGKKLEVKGGYQTPVTLFLGVISHVEISFGREGATIQVTALDCSSRLNNGERTQTFNAQEPKQIVQELLAVCEENGIGSIKKIAALPKSAVDVEQIGMDDGEFLYMLARRTGNQFAVIHGEIYFDNLLKNTSPLIELIYGQNLVAFRKETNTAKQLGEIKISGITKEGKRIMAAASSVDAQGSGSTAVQTDSSLKKKKQMVWDYSVETEAELKEIAENMLLERSMQYVRGSGQCIGIPELIPGRYIKFSGMDKSANGTYYLIKVTHSFGEDGYRTSFEFRGAKSN